MFYWYCYYYHCNYIITIETHINDNINTTLNMIIIVIVFVIANLLIPCIIISLKNCFWKITSVLVIADVHGLPRRMLQAWPQRAHWAHDVNDDPGRQHVLQRPAIWDARSSNFTRSHLGDDISLGHRWCTWVAHSNAQGMTSNMQKRKRCQWWPRPPMCSATPSDLANNARVWEMWGSTYHADLQRINRRSA